MSSTKIVVGLPKPLIFTVSLNKFKLLSKTAMLYLIVETLTLEKFPAK